MSRITGSRRSANAGRLMRMLLMWANGMSGRDYTAVCRRMSRSFESTAAPGLTRISAPEHRNPPRTAVSIFMASIESSFCPLRTASPRATATPTTRPGQGRADLDAGRSGRPWAARARPRRASGRPPRPRAAGR